MTSPRDPNTPQSAGEPSSGQPGTPPDAQPGYWGAPPPGYPGGMPPGWPAPPPKKGHGCLIAALIVSALMVVVVVGGCAWLIVGPIVQTEMKLNQHLGPRATSVDFHWNNGATTYVIRLAPGYESQAESIACEIVRPDVVTSSAPDAHFEIVSSGGFILADETTPCG